MTILVWLCQEEVSSLPYIKMQYKRNNHTSIINLEAEAFQYFHKFVIVIWKIDKKIKQKIDKKSNMINSP